MYLLNNTKYTVFARFLIRNIKPFNKYSGWSIFFFKSNFLINIKNYERFQKLRKHLFNKYELKHKAPITNACNFLESSNLLYKNLNKSTYIPCTTLSSFSCELFLKAWISEDQVTLSPIQEPPSYWVIHTGSQSFNYIKPRIKKSSEKHNLLKIFNILPNDIKMFYKLIYNYLYKYELENSLEASLNIVSDYFFQARYCHENLDKKYNVHLANTLANFFCDTIVILLNRQSDVTIYE